MFKWVDFLLGGSLWGNVAATGIGLAVLVGCWQVDKRLYGSAREKAGRQAERSKTRDANDTVVENARRVRDRVRNKRVRGVRDPHYID